MSVDEEILASVEQAEGSKATGSTKFKAGDHAAAAEAYQHGAGLLPSRSALSAQVRERKHACHELRELPAQARAVGGGGGGVRRRPRPRPQPQGAFRRAQALEKLDQDEEARAGFQQALKMEEDAGVHACRRARGG